MKRLMFLGLVFILGCGLFGGKEPPPVQIAKVVDQLDFERHYGERVLVEGIFNIWPDPFGKHAFITTVKKATVFIPHFDQFKQGEDWLRYEGQRVIIRGRLYFADHPIDGMPGPFIEIDHFELIR
jgi:hypothetical protein